MNDKADKAFWKLVALSGLRKFFGFNHPLSEQDLNKHVRDSPHFSFLFYFDKLKEKT